MFWSRWSKRISLGRAWSKVRSLWSCRSKNISLDRTWSKHRCFGRAGQNVSRLVESGRNIEVCGRAERNLSRLVEFGRNLDVLVAPVETYLAWSNLVETWMFWSRGSKRISHGRTCLKDRFFGRADRNISRLVELGQNLDVLVAPVETYLAWSNLVET